MRVMRYALHVVRLSRFSVRQSRVRRRAMQGLLALVLSWASCDMIKRVPHRSLDPDLKFACFGCTE